jgi:peptide/nickel transport system substrate-binding protein
MDDDNNPATPRIARGVVGIPDGTPFEVQYLTTDEADKQLAAQVVQTGLAQCGIKMNIVNLTSQELFASGPEGSLFGRKFDMAQYAWISSVEPACFLYLTEEIPGPYPEYPKGWGGANAPGYSNQTFDQACQKAQASLPGQPQYREFHLQAQAIFAEYLPVVPLYMRNKIIAMRSDLCQMQAGPSAESTLWNLESFSISQTCDQ